MERIFEYTVIFEPAEEGGYVVHAPALNGLATQGETLDEAREMAKDAINGYIETLQELGQPVPEDIAKSRQIAMERLEVAV